MQIINYPYARDQTADLLYTILLSIGGTDMDIEKIYLSTEDDLLYAILTVLAGKKNTQVVANYLAGADYVDRHTVNYPGIVGATGLLVFIGGIGLNDAAGATRYFLCNLTNAAAGGLNPGDIDLPAMTAEEMVLILKY